MSIIIINIKLLILKPWYTDNITNIIYYDKHWNAEQWTQRLATSCGKAVNEIENRQHHL